MSTNGSPRSTSYSRRNFLGLGAGVAASAALAACGGGSASSGGGGDKLKYWDMPWGQPAYNKEAQRLTESYKPAGDLPGATYQIIQWNNFSQTFASAVASQTGPAVSSGGGFQAFQFAEQGAIAYADKLVAAFKKDGTYDDFLPGQLEAMKTDKGYAAIPANLDMRVWWYRKSLLNEAGITPPTTWDQLADACRVLAKKKLWGFGTGAGAGNNLGSQGLVMMMINNGGGLFNQDGKVDCVTEANVEAMTFFRELVRMGAVDPAAVSYTGDNLTTQWKSKRIAMGVYTPGLDVDTGDSGDLDVLGPLTSPSGEKGVLVYQNNLMMYKNTPSQAGSEAFLSYYVKNMKVLWTKNLIPQLPVLKSIVATPEFQKLTAKAKIIKELLPVSKTFATKSTQLFGALGSVDSSQPITQFAQTMIAGKADPRAALITLQKALDEIVK